MVTCKGDPSEILRNVGSYKFADVSEEFTASIIRVKIIALIMEAVSISETQVNFCEVTRCSVFFNRQKTSGQCAHSIVTRIARYEPCVWSCDYTNKSLQRTSSQ